MSNTQTVAVIIRDQIKALDKWAFGAWGAKEFVNTEKGLKFKTSGMVRWKGYVHVILDEAKDLYRVEFFRIRGVRFIGDKVVTDVFVENLVDVINEQVG